MNLLFFYSVPSFAAEAMRGTVTDECTSDLNANFVLFFHASSFIVLLEK